jgi:AcrR family transcriptional regulator
VARQSERRDATRAALVAAARACFVEQGFEATSTEAVVARAGVSKGALYHHFANKAELMAAVFEAVSRETVRTSQAAAAAGGSSREALGMGLKAWLRAVLAPEPRRVILETGPAVLGYAQARRLEDAITQAPMRDSIRSAVERGEAQCRDADLASRILGAAVSELALTAAQRGSEPADLGAFDGLIDSLVDALVPPEPPPKVR